MVYEITGLGLSDHSVKFVNKDSNGYYFVLDGIDIDVSIPPVTQSISLDKTTINLPVGDNEQLTATTTPSAVAVSWTSSDSSVATVDSNGKVTGVKEV